MDNFPDMAAASDAPEIFPTAAQSIAPYRVWLIDEGHAGHRVQSEGVVGALRSLGVPLEVTTIACAPTLRGFLRPAARTIFRRMKGELALRFAKAAARFEVPDNGPPKFIISSGGRTAFVSRALSQWSGAPSVFVGNLGGVFPADWFSVVMSAIPLPAPNVINIGLVANTVTADECRAQAAAYWRGAVPENCWTLLIGGPNPNHRFGAEDWKNIAAGVNRLAEKYGIEWLISTSRRTGAEAERILETSISPHAIKELVIYSRDPKRVVLPFLGTGKIIFATRDSATMLSEAIASGRPVVSLLPKRIKLPPDNFMSLVLRRFNTLDQFSTLTCADLHIYTPHAKSDIIYDYALQRMTQATSELKHRLWL